MQAVTQSLSDGLGAIVGALPALIGAILILVIGFIIAKVLQGIVTRVLQSMGFQGWMESGGIKQFFDRSQTNQTPLSILGKLFLAGLLHCHHDGRGHLGDLCDLGRFGPVPRLHPADHGSVLILVLATLLANFVAGIVRGPQGATSSAVSCSTASSCLRRLRPSPSSG